jgi:beta-glucosidase
MLKKFFKIIGYLLLAILSLLIIGVCYLKIKSSSEAKDYRAMLGEAAPTLSVDGRQYRDLNKNGKLDPYEDSQAPLEARVNDLVSQMNLEEKAGSMFFTMTPVGKDGKAIEVLPWPTAGMDFALSMMGTQLKVVAADKLNHLNVLQGASPKVMAEWHNDLQRMAERTRLGIPITIGSDPRHYFSSNVYTAGDEAMTKWPEQLGFGAIGDSAIMRQFADIARQEYLAVGIRVALHPMADLATEPRWARISGTFGEDADLASRLIVPYIKGFQNGDSLNGGSVVCMTKHFSGGGPQKEGLDPHFAFQKGQVYPGDNFQYHLKPFEAAFGAKTGSIMPYYGIPTDQSSENVGFSFNKEIITGMLREKYQFDGVVCTDWGIITEKPVMPPAAWGVENLSEEERVLKVINAGVDQIGGENCPHYIISLVKSGKLTEERIDLSVKRLMRQKFVLGLFDNPYVDVEQASKIVGKADWKALGEQAQRRAMTLLKNDGNVLPLKEKQVKLFVKNMDKKVAEQYGTVVEKPADADFILVRANTPFVPVPGSSIIAKLFHHGDLDFKGEALQELLDLCKVKPTIFIINLDRPAVFPEINAAAKGVFGEFGASDAAVLDVVFGKAKPQGKLPFELPSSMEAVRGQKEDMPYDSKDPLYRFGFGLNY